MFRIARRKPARRMTDEIHASVSLDPQRETARVRAWVVLGDLWIPRKTREPRDEGPLGSVEQRCCR